jgi:ADP-heptose:LPS heptosyltransferase
MKTNYVLLCDGIGNIIQSIPFIKVLRTMSNKLIGINRADYKDSWKIVQKLFDDIIPHGLHSGTEYAIPPLEKFKHNPEYKSWFQFHNVPEPKEYKIERDDVYFDEIEDRVDFVIWGGCKPNWKSKMWPYWGNLAEILLSGFTVGVIGLPGEGGDFPKKVEDFRGKLTLTETGGLLDRSLYYIGNEGGLTHYANALQKTMWVIFGGSSPTKNMPPPREGYYDISLHLECQPCQWRLPGPKGCGDYKCLYKLTPEMVLNKINGVLYE